VAPIPFLWILPLSVYLLTFILCFDREGLYPRPLLATLHGAALAGMSYLVLRQTVNTPVKLVIPALAAGLFFCCMFCHGELVRRKPAARHLTSFYLMIALGGALGAATVGLFAPYVLNGFYELPLGLALCAFLTLTMEYKKNLYSDLAWMAVAVVAIAGAATQVRALSSDARFVGRNFYGGLRVVDLGPRRAMIHGTINHGTQFHDPARRRAATTYFSPGSGVQMAIEQFRRPNQRVGVIGLGVGTLAAYARPGDYYRFYELNPMVLDLARREFTFLADAQAKVDVVLGDGRLNLERETDLQYDVFVVDAFSGDSIPVHLLSREAFQLYFQRLRPGGALAIHVSNTALDLTQVVSRTVASLGKSSIRIHANPDPALDRWESDWILAADRAELLEQPLLLAAAKPVRLREDLLVWTDDYSTLFPILK
jgi:SAM-dependent methyltransferase